MQRGTCSLEYKGRAKASFSSVNVRSLRFSTIEASPSDLGTGNLATCEASSKDEAAVVDRVLTERRAALPRDSPRIEAIVPKKK